MHTVTLPAKLDLDAVRTGMIERIKFGRRPKKVGRPRNRFRPYKQARSFVHRLGLNSHSEWLAYVRSGSLPQDIPTVPHRVYSAWTNWKDWLGTGFLPYEEAKSLVQKMGLASEDEYKARFYDLFKRPYKVPRFPKEYYKAEWKGWLDFLGTTRRYTYRPAPHLAEYQFIKATHFRPYQEAMKFVATLRLQDRPAYIQFRKSYPHNDLPWNPELVYEEWAGWQEFLGHNALPALLVETSVLYVARRVGNPENVYVVAIEPLGRSALVHKAQAEKLQVIRAWEYLSDYREQVDDVMARNCSSYYGSETDYIVANVFGLFNDLFEYLAPVR